MNATVKVIPLCDLLPTNNTPNRYTPEAWEVNFFISITKY